MSLDLEIQPKRTFNINFGGREVSSALVVTNRAGSKWYFGYVDPDNAFANNDDCYLNFTNSKVFKKIAGVWVLQDKLTSAIPTLTISDITGLQTALDTINATISGLNKASVGLGNVDNTSDANKPVSTAQATAIANAIAALTKASVGLGNVDNTSDANKPVSTAQATAIANAIAALTKASVGLANVDNTSDANKPVSTATTAAINAAITALTKASVGLANVDNTSDANKPVSTATTAAINAAIAALTKASVGLANVDNTSDANKPVSNAQATAIAQRLLATSNLSDLSDKETSRLNLGVFPSNFFVKGLGRYSVGAINGSTMGVLASSRDVYRAYAFVLQEAITIDRLGIETSVAGAAGSKARVAICTMNSNNIPDAAIISTEVLIDSIANQVTTIANTVIPAGKYYLVTINNSVTNPSFRGPMPAACIAIGGALNALSFSFINANSIYPTGSWPSSLTSLTWTVANGNVPGVQHRII